MVELWCGHLVGGEYQLEGSHKLGDQRVVCWLHTASVLIFGVRITNAFKTTSWQFLSDQQVLLSDVAQEGQR